MAYDTIGDLLRDARERQNYSQEEVCYGICTSSTLSRIENGLQAPGKKLLEGLMERLGIGNLNTDISFTKKEAERYQLAQELVRCFGKQDYQRAQRIVKELEEKLRTVSGRESGIKMEQQYLCFAKALIEKNYGEQPEKVLKHLLKAISMTLPDFDGMHIYTRLLSSQEISILNNIGCIYHEMDRLWDAIRLLMELKEYMEKHSLENHQTSVKYPMILQNLSSWMGQEGYYRDALKLCQKGIDFCIEYGKMHTFPMLLYNKACALAELGQVGLSVEFFYESAVIYQAMGQREHAEQVRNNAKIYGIEI